MRRAAVTLSGGPVRLVVACLALAAAAGAGWWAGDRLQALQTERVRAQLAELKQQHAERVAAAEARARAAVEQSVAEQTTKALEVAAHAQSVLAAAERDRAAVRPALDRLRDAERSYWTRACRGGAAAAAAAGGGAPADQAAGVHPDVSGGFAAFAAIVGGFAEQSHAAATACEALSR